MNCIQGRFVTVVTTKFQSRSYNILYCSDRFAVLFICWYLVTTILDFNVVFVVDFICNYKPKNKENSIWGGRIIVLLAFISARYFNLQ